MYRLTLANRDTHVRTHARPHKCYIHLIWGIFNLKHSFFLLKDWSSIPWYRWKKYASLCENVCVCVCSEKCKVSNWFGDVSFMHFFVRMDNIHMLCINVYVYIYVASITFHFLCFHPSLPLQISLTVVIPSKKEHWNNIKLQTYFPNSISLYDEPHSRVPLLQKL